MIPGLEKVIILRYLVPIRLLNTVFRRFSEVFNVSFNRQWCFGRNVSFSMMIDEQSGSMNSDRVDVVFEFVNLNTFLSVQSLREWFERIICEYRLFTKEPLQNLMTFKFGSYHFIDRAKEREQSSFAVTASFHDLDLNPKTAFDRLIPKIGGIPVSIKSNQCNTISSRCTVNGQSFIDYHDPKLYRHLMAMNDVNQFAVSTNQKVHPRKDPPEYEQQSTQTVKQRANPSEFENESSSVGTPPPDMSPSKNQNVQKLIFRQFTESDYVYSDSENDAAMEIQRNQNEMKLLMAKHDEFGDGIDCDRGLQLFEDPDGSDLRNRLCPYCLMVLWSPEHRKECLFIPQCLQ